MKINIINKSENPNPKYATKGSAGFDIMANEDVIINGGEVKAVSTGLYFGIPEGLELQIRPRSGLSLKKITVFNAPGTIDSDYTGEVKIILFNANNNIQGFPIKKGDRIAQGIVSKVESIEFENVKELSETERGTSGFGSTGT